MDVCFLNESGLKNLMDILLAYGKIFAAMEAEVASNRNSKSKIFIREMGKELLANYRIPGFRTFDNFKSFVLPIRFKVADYQDENWVNIKDIDKKKVLVGLKACDIASFSILDKVFLEDNDLSTLFIKEEENL